MDKKVCMTLFKFDEIVLNCQKLIDIIESLIVNNALEYIFFDSTLDLDPTYYPLIFDLKIKYPHIKMVEVLEDESFENNHNCYITPSNNTKYDGCVYFRFSCNNKNNHFYFIQSDLIDNSTYCIFYGNKFILSPTYTYALQHNKNIIII